MPPLNKKSNPSPKKRYDNGVVTVTVESTKKRHSFAAVILTASLLAATILVSKSSLETLNVPDPPFLHHRISRLPKIILWAWERPENLGFIDPHEIGVAFLAGTIYLRDERVVIRPRLQPLNVPPGTALIAVVRIESDGTEPPNFASIRQSNVVSAVSELTRIQGITAIQVDFDAKKSERAFYRDLLFNLRRQLPTSMALSITGLASWCIYDDWLTGLPVDEAVPMLFRMGVDHRNVLLHLNEGTDFQSPICRHSLGISTDEPMPRLPAGRRVYIFHPQAWSKEAVHKIIKEVEDGIKDQ